MKPKFRLLASVIATILAPQAAHAQTIQWVNTGSATAWYTDTNWNPNTSSAQWLTTDIAQFANSGSATTAGINMGTASLSIGAIEITAARTRALTIGNSSTTAGTLTLNGTTVNSVDNVILRNASNSRLTLQDNETGTGKTMNVVLGNATNNVVLIEGTGGITIASEISGTGRQLTLQGGGTGPLILSGTNSYDGGTTVSTGTLSFNTLASKATTGTHTFAAGTTLGLGFGGATRFTATDIVNAFAGDFTGNLAGISIGSTNNIAIDTTGGAQTFSANIGPSDRGLEKILLGQNLTLTGANQYSGRTVVWGGSALRVNDPGNIGDSSSNLGTNSTVDLMNGAFFTVVAPTAPVSSNRNFNLLGGAIIMGLGSTTNTIELSGNISTETAGTKTMDFRTNVVGTHTVSGIISDGSGTLNVNKSNNGTWILAGANTHTGTTTVQAGTLTLSNSLALQNSTLNTTGSVTGTLSAGLRTTETALTFGGLSGNKNLAAVFTMTSGGYSGVTALTLNPGTGASPVYTAGIGNGAVGMTLTKTGAGTQTLSGVNIYTGTTTINAGTLALGAAGSIDNTSGVILGGGVFDISAKVGGYTVNNLSGNGTVAGSLTVSTQLSIGSSPGTIGFGSLTLASSATYLYELTGGGTAADLGNVSGTLNLGGATLDLVQLGTFTVGDRFTLFGYDDGNLTGTFNGLADGDTLSGAGGLWLIDYDDTAAGLNGGTGDRFVTITAIPEPHAALLGGLGLLALLRRRRA